jgi:hypothetical protein
VPLTLAISFTVTGLDQFLHTTAGQFSAQPVTQVGHWVTGSLITLPLFALGVWAGEWIAGRLGISMAASSGVLKRALVIVFLVSVALVPLWFVRNKKDAIATAQALVTPHSQGSVDVYTVSGAVIVALVCVCLVPAAVWAGRGLSGRRGMRLPSLAAAPLLVLAAAGAVALAWLLHQTAEHAYASQVDYTSALMRVPVRSHAFFGGRRSPGLPGAPVRAAPFAFVYQISHALQDGLAGQAAGLPAAVITLLWGTRGRRVTYQQADTMEVPR